LGKNFATALAHLGELPLNFAKAGFLVDAAALHFGQFDLRLHSELRKYARISPRIRGSSTALPLAP
jgi:hypothetical protein